MNMPDNVEFPSRVVHEMTSGFSGDRAVVLGLEAVHEQLCVMTDIFREALRLQIEDEERYNDPGTPVEAEEVVDQSSVPDRTKPTREELIQLCVDGIVRENDWRNRDSGTAHLQLGQCWALLSAGCDFTVNTTDRDEGNTWWIDVYYCGFDCHEYGPDDGVSSVRGDGKQHERFYLPTRARIERNTGKDWY